mmetsp:Transcript_7304/g.28780  ORF Transcript_7304/g.28780 Transcript_7304/m.28780 type:complete len:313 (+) Transcript_7304:1095-2033(+)
MNWRRRTSRTRLRRRPGRSAPPPRSSNAWRGWSETGRLDRRSRPEAGPSAGPALSMALKGETTIAAAPRGTRDESRRPRTRRCTGCSTPRPGDCGPCRGWTAPPRGPPVGPSRTGAAPRVPARTSSSFDRRRRAAPTPTPTTTTRPATSVAVNPAAARWTSTRSSATSPRRTVARSPPRRARFVSRPARTGGTRRRRSSRGRGSFAGGLAPSTRRYVASRNRPPSQGRRRSRPSRGSARRRCGTTRRRRTRGATRRWRSRPPRCSTFMKGTLPPPQTRSTADERTTTTTPAPETARRFGGSPSPRRTRFAMR